jgi:hypothetical protein
MSIYTKPTVLPAWGETNTTSADMIQPSNSSIATGWVLSTLAPVRQYWNWVLNYVDVGIRYFMQRGLVDWDTAETYQIGARIIGDDNNTYTSIVNNNIGNVPSTSPTDWQPWALSVAQINATTLTQATRPAGDSTIDVANTQFVTNGIAAAIAALVIPAGATCKIGTITVGAMTYMILRIVPSSGTPIEIAYGVGQFGNGGTIPLPTSNFAYAQAMLTASVNSIPNGGRTINNITCGISNPSTGTVSVYGTDNTGGSSGGGTANVIAMAWRTNATPASI